MVQAKRVVPLAVTSLKRLAALTSVPTIAESGFPGFEVTNNHGILAPARTPAPIVNALNAEIQNMLLTEEARARLQSQGVEPAGSTPQEFGDIVKKELARWTRVIREAGISVNP
jgi:tripartite-type tricarboxylate transporter receptor subunit TctC